MCLGPFSSISLFSPHCGEREALPFVQQCIVYWSTPGSIACSLFRFIIYLHALDCAVYAQIIRRYSAHFFHTERKKVAVQYIDIKFSLIILLYFTPKSSICAEVCNYQNAQFKCSSVQIVLYRILRALQGYTSVVNDIMFAKLVRTSAVQ